MSSLYGKGNAYTMKKAILSITMDQEIANKFKQITQDKGYYYTTVLRDFVLEYIKDK